MKKLLNKLKSYYHWYTKSNQEYARHLGVKIGKDCRIYIRDFGSEPWLINIGDKVTVTHGVRFINHDGFPHGLLLTRKEEDNCLRESILGIMFL